MHMQVITFKLDGIDDAAYRAHAEQNAPVFAALPGLRAKIWLANQQANAYGGIYTWERRRRDEGLPGREDLPRIAGEPAHDRRGRQGLLCPGRAHGGDPRRVLTDD
jgi:Putative mono-oxygenase ydhR